MPSISLNLLTTEDFRIELGDVSQLAVSLSSSAIPEESTLYYSASLQSGFNGDSYTSFEPLLNTNVNISSDPYTLNFDVKLGIPTFKLSEETRKSNDWNVNISAHSFVEKSFIYDEMNKHIVVPVSVDQLLPSPDIFSVNTFSAEQIIGLGKYIQSTTHNIALKSYETDDLESKTLFKFVYIPATNNSRKNQDTTWRSYREPPDNPALFELIITKENIEPISPESIQIISNAYEDFVESDSTKFWHEQIQFQREAKDDNDFLLFQTVNGTYGFLNDHSHFGPGQLLKFKDGFDFENLNELNGNSELKWYSWWKNNKENPDVFAWAIGELVGTHTEYFVLSNAKILFWEYSNSEAKIFDETSQELITFPVHEEGYEVNLADAVITNDDNLLLLVSGNDGVGGNHYFAKLYDLTGTHQKTVLLSSNGYDGSIIKLNNDQYGMIIDTTVQVISSELSSFSIPIDLNIDAWSTTRTQQFSEQLIKVAKFNGSDNWFNDLLWMNSQLDDGDNTYFSTKVDDTIMSFEGDDVVFAGVGEDIVSGGAGNDKLYGNEGNDTLKDGIGSDVILGGSGDDSIELVSETRFAGPYVAYNVKTKVQESLFGKSKYTASINGETGIDTIILMDSENGDAFFLHDAYSEIHQSVSTTIDDKGMQTSARVIGVETILAGDGDDIIDLTSDTFDMGGTNITLKGEAGNDVLWAAEGNDYLVGGIGDDTLFGGDGDDILTGGDGADIFEFVQSSLLETDTITDYTSADSLKFYLDENASRITEADYDVGIIKWGNINIVLDTGIEWDDLTIAYTEI